MSKEIRDPGPKEKKQGPDTGTRPDTTPRREEGDDALAESSPTDSRSDKKVIVNEQKESKIVNAPPQTSVNTSE
jgi:hypothetical protein